MKKKESRKKENSTEIHMAKTTSCQIKIAILSRHINPCVRLAVVKNPQAPAHILETLSRDKSTQVSYLSSLKRGVCKNKKLLEIPYFNKCTICETFESQKDCFGCEKPKTVINKFCKPKSQGES